MRRIPRDPPKARLISRRAALLIKTKSAPWLRILQPCSRIRDATSGGVARCCILDSPCRVILMLASILKFHKIIVLKFKRSYQIGGSSEFTGVKPFVSRQVRRIDSTIPLRAFRRSSITSIRSSRLATLRGASSVGEAGFSA